MARRPIIAAAACFAVLTALASFVALRLELRTDLSFFLPRIAAPDTQLVVEGLRRGPTAGLVLMAISGGSPDQRESASDALARALDDGDRVTLIANGRPHLDKAAMEALRRYRYVLNPAPERAAFSADALRQKLKRALDMLGTSMGGAVKSILPADPTLRVLDIAAGWARADGPERRNGVWVSDDGRWALLVAWPLVPTLDSSAQRDLLELIRSSFASAAGAAGLRLHMTGPSVFAAATRKAIQSDVQWLSILSLALVAALLLAAFRSPRLLGLLLIPIASGVLGGVAAVQLVFGNVHGITLAFGSTLIGVAIDYPLHLAVHTTRSLPGRAAIDGIWPTMRLGALTTVAAFLPLTLSSFPGLSQLGVFTMAGLIAAAAVTRWLIPELFTPGGGALAWQRRIGWSRAAAAGRWIAPGAGIAAVAAVAYFAIGDRTHWENDLRNLSPVPKTQLRFDGTLRSQLRAPDVRRLIVIHGDSAESVLQRGEALLPRLRGFVDNGALAGFDMAARTFPSMRTQKSRSAALPDRRTLEANLSAALTGLPFRAGLFAPFRDDVERARTGAPARYEDFAASPVGWRVAPLLYRSDGRWVGLVQLVGVSDPAAIAGWVRGLKDRRTMFVDLKRETEALVASYRREALRWLAVGAVAALLMLIAGLRNAATVARVMTPICLSVLLTAAILSAAGQALSIIHLLALLLVAGLGLDYGLYFNRTFTSADEVRRTSTAVVLCSLTTVTVFAILAFSRLSVLNSIGRTVAVGAALSLLLSYGFRRNPPPEAMQ